MMNYNEMTDKELSARRKKLGDMLEMMNPCDNDWDDIYGEYFAIVAIQDERYREANQEDFDAFYEKNIKGKRWEEIDPDLWCFYSDWHKDMYGYRPRRI
jgi:hypothetical protein